MAGVSSRFGSKRGNLIRPETKSWWVDADMSETGLSMPNSDTVVDGNTGGRAPSRKLSAPMVAAMDKAIYDTKLYGLRA